MCKSETVNQGNLDRGGQQIFASGIHFSPAYTVQSRVRSPS
jgi:hypothetical protein